MITRAVRRTKIAFVSNHAFAVQSQHRFQTPIVKEIAR